MRQTSHPYVDLKLISDQIDNVQTTEDFDLVRAAFRPNLVLSKNYILDISGFKPNKSCGFKSWALHGRLVAGFEDEQKHPN